MASRLGKIGMRTMAGALVATGPVIAACETGPSYEEWAATDGAAGRINLDEVQAAFKSAKSGTDFERRVNEIYEGDKLVLIKVKQDAEGTTVEAWENLNKNLVIDEGDDLLFSIQERADKSYNMRGYGANGYYNSGFGAGNFFLTALVLSSMRPYGGAYYYAQPGRAHYSRLNSQRSTYRRSSGYRSQVSKNTRYFNRQGNFAGTRFEDAGRNLGSSRRTYQSTQKSTSGFKNSATGVRSSWGSSGRGSSFGRGGSRGGFGGGGRGFGGGQVIIGDIGL